MRVDRVELSGGDFFNPAEAGVLLVVGPNNVGKSVFLRELHQLLSQGPHPHSPTTVIASLDATANGSLADLEAWLDERAHRREFPGQGAVYSGVGLGRVSLAQLQSEWSSAPPLRSITGLLVSMLGATERLGLLGSGQLWDMATEDPQQPLQTLYADVTTEQALRDAAIKAFGVPVFINRYAGNQIHLQVGPPPEAVAPPAPRQLVRELSAYPHVHQQGDGFRSFVGIILSLLTGDHSIVLIDEPEAFLHPPQARQLGRVLAERTTTGKQVVASTHSSDIVIGALSQSVASVTVVRLTRDGSQNHARVLSHDALRTLWSDPLLRYSNVMDGLFHRAVVVCESDADAMFFNAALEHLLEVEGLPQADLLFTHASTKSRLFRIAAALEGVGVPVICIADIDILSDFGDVKRTVEAMGFRADDLEEDVRRVIRDVAGRVQRPNADYVRGEFEQLFAGTEGGAPLPDSAIQRMRELLKEGRGWASLKELGVDSLSGQTNALLRDLMRRASSVGLLIVDGELETFDRSVAGHGPSWVEAALEAGAHKNPRAQEFVRRLAVSLGLVSDAAKADG